MPVTSRIWLGRDVHHNELLDFFRKPVSKSHNDLAAERVPEKNGLVESMPVYEPFQILDQSFVIKVRAVG